MLAQFLRRSVDLEYAESNFRVGIAFQSCSSGTSIVSPGGRPGEHLLFSVACPVTSKTRKKNGLGIEIRPNFRHALLQTEGGLESMQLRTLLICAALSSAAAFSQEPGLLGAIVTSDRAVAPINPALT